MDGNPLVTTTLTKIQESGGIFTMFHRASAMKYITNKAVHKVLKLA